MKATKCCLCSFLKTLFLAQTSSNSLFLLILILHTHLTFRWSLLCFFFFQENKTKEFERKSLDMTQKYEQSQKVLSEKNLQIENMNRDIQNNVSSVFKFILFLFFCLLLIWFYRIIGKQKKKRNNKIKLENIFCLFLPIFISGWYGHDFICCNFITIAMILTSFFQLAKI